MHAIVASRDRAAFERLFAHFAPRLKSHFLARGQSQVQAEELTSETMFAVWSRAQQFDSQKGAVSTWIFTLARNLLIDRLRAEKRQGAALADFASQNEIVDATKAASPEEYAVSVEREQNLRHALAELPPEQAHVLERSFAGGLSLAEIATAESLPLGTVKTRARLALARLREIFDRGAP